MAQKVIMVSEKELADLKREIVKEIHNFSKRSYGFKMVSRETGEEITDTTQVLGMFLHPIGNAIETILKLESTQ